MTLKAIVETLEGLPADVAKEYIEQDDGTFRLDVEGGEDTGALKRAKDHEKKLRKEAQLKNQKLQDKITELEGDLEDLKDPGESKKDDRLRAKYEAQMVALRTELTGESQVWMNEVRRLSSTQTAERIATELFTSLTLGLPHVKSRLTTELEDGKAVVKVLDSDGDVGVMTLEDLKRELRANKELAPILKGGKGSGSGAPGATNGGKGKDAKTKLSDYSGQERLELQRENPEEFKRLVNEARGIKK